MTNQADAALPTPAEIVAFWRSAGSARWFAKNDAFDRELVQRFAAAHLAAAARRFDDWNDNADGALALQLLLDQMPRNIYRGTAHAFATDPLARHYALAALDRGFDTDVAADLRQFCYMALMHAEDLALQRRCVSLFEQLGGAGLPFAREHCDIIERFGRFPHRNAVLGRTTTAAEQAFLDAGGFAG